MICLMKNYTQNKANSKFLFFIINPNENITVFHQKTFTTCRKVRYAFHAVATPTASRDKLNKLMANDSTPLTRAFFVCSLRTPQEINRYNMAVFLSMVERNRQPFAVGYVPLVVVCHPVTLYRPTVTSLAVVPNHSLMETNAMNLFIFAAIRRTDLTNHIQKIRILAESEHTARKALAKHFILCLMGKIAPHRISYYTAKSAVHSHPIFTEESIQGGQYVRCE